MNKTRIYLSIGGFLLGFGLALIATFIPWIPEWFGFQLTLCVAGWLVALAGALLTIRGAWLATREYMLLGFRLAITVLPGLLMLGLIGFGVLFSAFELTGGFFEPTLSHKVEFHDPAATVYFYDTGFMDAQTTVYLRRGVLPIMEQVAVLRYYLDDSDPAIQSGEWADFSGFQVNLVTGASSETIKQ